MTDDAQHFLYRDLVPTTDPVLQEATPRFDFSDPPMDPHELAHILAQTMIKNEGFSLSAPQIGLPYRVFVAMGNPILCCFNPRIVDESEDTLMMEEGCLSHPNLYVKIRRPQVIRIRYTRPNGETVTEQYQDLTARVMQHELDHLDGVSYLSRANSIHLEQSRTKAKKVLREKKKSSIIMPNRQLIV